MHWVYNKSKVFQMFVKAKKKKKHSMATITTTFWNCIFIQNKYFTELTLQVRSLSALSPPLPPQWGKHSAIDSSDVRSCDRDLIGFICTTECKLMSRLAAAMQQQSPTQAGGSGGSSAGTVEADRLKGNFQWDNRGNLVTTWVPLYCQPICRQ